MATTFEKLISLVAYDNALTERTDDFYLRAKTQPRTLGITEIARETARQLGKYGENPLGSRTSTPIVRRIMTIRFSVIWAKSFPNLRQ